MDCPEAVAACLSSLKNRAQATSLVTNIQLYFHILITLIGSCSSQTKDSPDVVHLHQQRLPQTALQAPQCQRNALGCLKAWRLEDLPKGCNTNDTFKLIVLRFTQTSHKPFSFSSHTYSTLFHISHTCDSPFPHLLHSDS